MAIRAPGPRLPPGFPAPDPRFPPISCCATNSVRVKRGRTFCVPLSAFRPPLFKHVNPQPRGRPPMKTNPKPRIGNPKSPAARVHFDSESTPLNPNSWLLKPQNSRVSSKECIDPIDCIDRIDRATHPATSATRQNPHPTAPRIFNTLRSPRKREYSSSSSSSARGGLESVESRKRRGGAPSYGDAVAGKRKW